MTFQDPRPHVSFAWLLGDEEQAVSQHIDKVRKAMSGSGMAWRDNAWSQQASLNSASITFCGTSGF